MTWIKFLCWLLGIYSLYYMVVILLDNMRGATRTDSGNDRFPQLTFAGDVAAVRLEPGLTTSSIESPMFSSGGVSLKQLFNLAQEEAVEFTRKVSF